MASYGKLKFKESNESDKVFSLGYNYMLSKRTDVYGVFTNNQYTGEKSGQTFAVGIRHNF
jgi:predicted porin